MKKANSEIKKEFAAALDDLIEQIRNDRSVLAAILCGSLSHDTVWVNSDIDLALVTADGGKTEASSLSLNASGVNVHAFMMPRSEFRKVAEGSIRHSFMHSLLAKGRLLYTHDETVAQLCDRMHEIGERDTQIQLLNAATHALPLIYKAHKWFVTRGDLDYTSLWLLNTATALARVEVIGARLLADREVITQAITLNPPLFKAIYSDLLNKPRTARSVQAALDAVDSYLAERAPTLFRLVLDYLREAAEARSCTEIEAHFKRQFGIDCVTTACEYLADRRLIGKVSTPVQITKRSNVIVQELAFVYLGAPPDDY